MVEWRWIHAVCVREYLPVWSCRELVREQCQFGWVFNTVGESIIPRLIFASSWSYS